MGQTYLEATSTSQATTEPGQHKKQLLMRRSLLVSWELYEGFAARLIETEKLEVARQWLHLARRGYYDDGVNIFFFDTFFLNLLIIL